MNSNSLKNGIYSFIIPGLGEMMNGDMQKGTVLIAGAIILHLFIWFFMNNPMGSLINTAYHAYAGYESYRNY